MALGMFGCYNHPKEPLFFFLTKQGGNVDLKQMGENLGLEPVEFADIVTLFVTTAESDIEKIRKGVLQKDALSVSEAAHSLKGSSGNLGFLQMSDVALTAEKKASENNLTGFEDMTRILTDHLNEIKTLLKQV